MDCSGKPSVELVPFGRMELCAPDKFPKKNEKEVKKMDEIKNLVKKLQWYQEKEFPYSPEGIDDIIYTTELFEYIIEIYPRTLISKNQ
ncbi:MAG: hypothetical protein QXU79_04005, partial [Candidatus Micrarchaeaceae archaeon]